MLSEMQHVASGIDMDKSGEPARASAKRQVRLSARVLERVLLWFRLDQ